ncbi:uncharacterized protein LOC127001818 [Eriocheir sinensis]|uniref:uncharacterized protein LOC127001818 n=1 Tax=Eriocheir sinensis TaxID=95602 RepID=UPI0021C93684|nr:uncharacterized protein LOC127001818 [Eriocheir sinensis]
MVSSYSVSVDQRALQTNAMAANKYTLANCCLCISLRTGSLIIGIISLVFSLVGAGFSIFVGVTGGAEGWVDLAIDLVHFALAVILIHGIRTEREGLLKVWIIGTGFLVGLSIILGIIIILLTNSIVAAILLLVVSAIQIYFILVVRSYSLTLSAGPPVVA